MPLAGGSRIGSYEVTSLLGKGDMREVYRARDTKLDRDVAIKVLPPAFVNNADRLGRFQREEKVLASLNHPNIATIYTLEVAVKSATSGAKPTFEVGTPEALFDSRMLVGPNAHQYDVTADGKRFLVAAVGGSDATTAPPLTVVVNWLGGLKK